MRRFYGGCTLDRRADTEGISARDVSLCGEQHNRNYFGQ